MDFPLATILIPAMDMLRPPPDDALRRVVHDEVHARPMPLITLPARVLYVAVRHAADNSREQELAHLQTLPGQSGLTQADLASSFARMRLSAASSGQASQVLQWERHTEFTRYVLLLPLPAGCCAGLDPQPPGIDPEIRRWLAGIPGQTIAAIDLWMLHDELDPAQTEDRMERARRWFAAMHGDLQQPVRLFGAQLGQGHSWGLSDFQIGPDGFERMLVLAPQATSDERAGRIALRLLELETYRLMALRGLPTAKQLGPFLHQAEQELVTITGQMKQDEAIEEELLDRLIALAASVERATAEHAWRYSASRAYFALVRARMDELREKPIRGTQSMRDFIQRRTSPAMATVAASEERLSALSERISRSSGLLRTRIDISAEQQSQQLLHKLTRGQELQTRLQTTVEGLSIAAISYYMVSLVLYAAKAAKGAGLLPWQPETVAGVSIPFVLLLVWWLTRRIHHKLSHDIGGH